MNNLLKYAQVIKNAAKKLTDDELSIENDKVDETTGKQLQQYSLFIRKFLSVKGNDEVFAKLTPLFDNPRLKKPRNAILLMLEKNEERNPKQSQEIISEIRRIILRYGKVSNRYPAIQLLKDILGYGIEAGIPAFKRLLSIERRLYNTFSSQGKLERQKREEQKQKD